MNERGSLVLEGPPSKPAGCLCRWSQPGFPPWLSTSCSLRAPILALDTTWVFLSQTTFHSNTECWFFSCHFGLTLFPGCDAYYLGSKFLVSEISIHVHGCRNNSDHKLGNIKQPKICHLEVLEVKLLKCKAKVKIKTWTEVPSFLEPLKRQFIPCQVHLLEAACILYTVPASLQFLLYCSHCNLGSTCFLFLRTLSRPM